MAINLNDKKLIMDQVLPAVDISQSINGIIVTSERIAVPRRIAFDIVGKCRECKATEAETEWCISKEGVTIWCTRFKNSPKFVPFDFVYELPGYTFFKIRNRGRVFNVDHGVREEVCTPKQFYSLPPPPPPPKLHPRQQNPKQSHEQSYNDADFIAALSAATTGMVVDKKKSKPQQADAAVFMEALSAATTGMEIDNNKPQKADASVFMEALSAATAGMNTQPNKQSKQPDTPEFFAALSAATAGLSNGQKQHKKTSKQPKGDATDFFAALSAATTGVDIQDQKQQQQSLTKGQTDQEILDEFLDSVSAVTTHLDITQKDKPKKRKKETKEEEEMKAIATITPKP